MSDATCAASVLESPKVFTRFDLMPVSNYQCPKYCTVDVFVKGAYFVPPSPTSDGKRSVFYTLLCDFSGALVKIACSQEIMLQLCIAVKQKDFSHPVRLYNCFRTEIAAMWAMTCLDGIGLATSQLNCDESAYVGFCEPSDIPRAPRCAISLRGDFPTVRSECVYSVVVALVKTRVLDVNPRDSSSKILKCNVVDSTGRVLQITDWNHEKHTYASVPDAGAPAAFFFFVPPADSVKNRSHFNHMHVMQNMSLSFVNTHPLGATMSSLFAEAARYKEAPVSVADKPAALPSNAIVVSDADIAELMRERGQLHKGAMQQA